MLLAHKTTIDISDDYANIIGHMCYAAYKLWNVCNYERMHYEERNLPSYPNWYYQKKAHKDDIWYKQLPSQTAQEVCKQLDGGWKSFFKDSFWESLFCIPKKSEPVSKICSIRIADFCKFCLFSDSAIFHILFYT